MKSPRFLVVLGLATVSFVWGSTWLAIKIGLQSMPPFLGAGIRFVIAATLLLLILKGRRLSIANTPDARKVYLTLGFLSFGLSYAAVYWAEQYIESSLTSILFAAYPFWVALFSHFLLEREKLDRFKLAGISTAFIGLLVIYVQDLHALEPGAFPAMLAVLLSTIVQAYTLVLIKKHGQPLSPFVMNFVGMSLGAVVLLGLSAALERSHPVVWDSAAVLSILYLAVFGTVVAFVTYYWLLKRIEALFLSLTSFINPIVAVILGALILDERLSSRVFVGASFVLAGILIANGQSIGAKARRVA